MIVKSSARVGAQEGGNLNKLIFKSSNARGIAWGGGGGAGGGWGERRGMLMFITDRRIRLK